MSYRCIVRLMFGCVIFLCASVFTINPVFAGVAERVSISSSGGEGNGQSGLYSSSYMSSDGRFIAFESTATNLVTGDTNGFKDIFVHDRQTGITEVVSISSTDTLGNGNSSAPSISADGRYVAFESAASNLVLSDTNGFKDVFLHDRLTGVTERVSVSGSGAQGNGISGLPSVSGDGRYIAFESAATNLVALDNNTAYDVFVRDRQIGVTEKISISTSGLPSGFTADNLDPVISPDGRYVAFESEANWIFGDFSYYSDIFIRDRQTGVTEVVSKSYNGTVTNNHSWDPSISSDGRYIAYTSFASDIVIGDTNGYRDIFVFDRQTNTTQRISVSSTGMQGNQTSNNASISSNGRYVVFDSIADNLVDGTAVPLKYERAYLYDTQNSQTKLASMSYTGASIGSAAGNPVISATGMYITFSGDDTVVAGDTNGVTDVFFRTNGFLDLDGDGWDTDADCNDSNAAINPGAAEVCNGVDENCNTQIDEGVQNTYYQDADIDLYGNASVTTLSCTQPVGFVSDNTDCNDGNSSINPGTAEVCNGVDDNCNTQIDEGIQNTYYQDLDGDMYGDASVSTQACTVLIGYTSDNTDCNDSNAAINPSAAEVCGNGVDDNCNTQIDEACTLSADLSIILADLPDPVTPAGQNVTYTITVTNNGPAYATGVTVTDVLDASLTLVSATPSQGAPCTGTGTITCNLGSMISGSSATVTVVATTSLTPGMIGNSASVTATEPDPNNTNNTAVQTTNVGDISREVGISTRGYVDTGTNIMVGGFSFGGTVSKKVLIRGRGPSMSGAPYNFTGTLTNPTLEIYSGATLFATVDDWQSGATMCNAPAVSCGTPAELLAALTDPCQPNAGQTTAPPGCMQEAALYITLPPGAYTVKLKGVSPSDIGKGIMEVYDADTTSLTMLGGISTRGKVLTGTDVMVGGFIVGAGTTNKTLLLRGRGPSLSGAPYNFTGTLTNPTLEIYSGPTLFATVDDWQAGASMCNAPAISCGTPSELQTALVDPCQPNVGQTTAPPGCTQESAMFITLPPGAYTAKLKGVNNDTGIGIFEVYEMP